MIKGSETNGEQIAPRLSPAEIDQIAAFPDPFVRNLQITQCYHELSAVLGARTGQSANWCTFATWASRQAGQTIRREDLVRTLEYVLEATPATAQAARNVATAAQAIGALYGDAELEESVWDTLNPAAAIDRASDAVARGNKKVFEEIGREFARFFVTCLPDASFDAEKIGRFCDELRPGEPPEGQQYLRQAFRRYYDSLFEDDAKARAELLLLANIEIGFHEQTRLQPEIAEALEAAVIDPRKFRNQLMTAVFPYRGWLAYIQLLLKRLFRRPTPFDAAVERLVTLARLQARRTITQHIMTITLAQGVRLRLGTDLDAAFPDSLKQLSNPELRALLARIDPTADSLFGTGAADWADLRQRLHFIADMFRCYQESSELFKPPFTGDQVAALKVGRLPEGQL